MTDKAFAKPSAIPTRDESVLRPATQRIRCDAYQEFIERSSRQLMAVPDNTIGLLSGHEFVQLQPHLFQAVRQGQARFGLPCDKLADDITAHFSARRRTIAYKVRFWTMRGLKYAVLLLRLLWLGFVVLPWTCRGTERKPQHGATGEPCIPVAPRPPDEGPPQASIVVLSFNRLPYLVNTLPAVWETNGGPRYELIVVDNGSQDGSVEYLKDVQAKGLVAKVVLLGENRGISAGYNLGFAAADRRSQYLVKLDSDIRILSPDWLAKAAAFLSANPDVGFVALNQLNHGYLRSLPRLRVGSVDVMDFAGWPCGSASVIPRRVRNELGCFVEEPSMMYVPDDIDYYVRASRKGYRVFFLRHVWAYHQRIFDKGRYRSYDEGKPRRQSAELALRLARDYDRGLRPLELHFEKYHAVTVPEEGILVV